MTYSAWGSLIQWTFWAIAMAAIMGWMKRSRDQPRATGVDDGRLRHPPAMLIVGIVSTCFGATVAVAIVFAAHAGNPTATLGICALFAGFALMSSSMIVEYVNARHEVSADGMKFSGLFARRGEFRWDELRSVRYSVPLKWFVLTLADGRKVRLSAMLRGLPGFARQLLAHAPAVAASDAATLDILRETADGRPPSIWM